MKMTTCMSRGAKDLGFLFPEPLCKFPRVDELRHHSLPMPKGAHDIVPKRVPTSAVLITKTDLQQGSLVALQHCLIGPQCHAKLVTRKEKDHMDLDPRGSILVVPSVYLWSNLVTFSDWLRMLAHVLYRYTADT